MGALQARKSCGRGPKAKILSLARPRMIRATGTKPAIMAATSSGTPTGYSGM